MSVTGLGGTLLGVGIAWGSLKGDVDRARADATAAHAKADALLIDVEGRRLADMRIQENHDARIRALEAMQADNARIIRSNDVILSKLDALCRATRLANCGP